MKTEIKNKQFLLDGKPFRILSGEMHYFRIPREYWRDRLLKLKACGLNTVATYMPWNLHERTPGKFDFSGMLDVRAFSNLRMNLESKFCCVPVHTSAPNGNSADSPHGCLRSKVCVCAA